MRKPDAALARANNIHLTSFLPTGSKRYVGELLPSGGVVAEVAVGLELHSFVPGVVQAVVDGRRDADLVARWDGEPCCRLCEAED